MNKSQLKRYKKLLKARRNELKQEIGELRERLSIDPESDPMDQVRSVSEREFAIRTVDQKCVLLRLVDDALAAIRAGTYGACSNCGEDIPDRRLEAVPWAPYCICCQEIRERSDAGRQSTEIAQYAIAS
jgi:DnaK suppressor protein